MANIMDFLSGFQMTPDMADRLGGIGQALGALQGRQVDVSPYADRINARAGLEEAMGNEQLLAKFTPEQRAALAQLGKTNPQAAQDVIMQANLAVDQDAKNAERMMQLRQNPLWSSLSMEQQAALEAVGPDQAGSVLAEIAFAQPEPQARILSPDEVAAYGLPQGSYQQKPDGSISQIGDAGQTINVNTGGQSNVIEYDQKTGTALVADPNSETGMRIVNVPGGAGEQEQAKASRQTESMIATVDDLMNDPGLPNAVGVAGKVTGVLGPLAPDATRARSKIEQLQGQAFLQAFESLKGGGQITEVEGKKAEQAIARLNTAQSYEDYMGALSDLRSVLETAQSRQGGQPIQQPQGQVLVFDPATGGFK